MSTLLGLETSTEACSVGLWRDGRIRLDHRVVPRRHNALVLEMIDDLLAAERVTRRALDGVACSCGPGSFTGVRIAAGVAQGIALALDLEVLAISSLATLAETVRVHRAVDAEAPGVVTLTRARPGLCYHAAFAFDRDAPRRLGEERIEPLESVSFDGRAGWLLAGSAVADVTIPEGMTALAGILPDAAALLRLAAAARRRGAGRPPAAALPTYLDGDTPFRSSQA